MSNLVPRIAELGSKSIKLVKFRSMVARLGSKMVQLESKMAKQKSKLVGIGPKMARLGS